MSKDDLLFGEDELLQPITDKNSGLDMPTHAKPAWKLLIVDDEHEVHATTRLVLGDFSFEGAGLTFFSAYSSAEVLTIMQEHNDIAVILMDVVMETPNAGLDCVRDIRRDLGNTLVRIILRTGQPGQAPERKVIVEYDINDYKNKTEITSQQLFTSVYAAIRSYRDMLSLEKQRIGLNYIIEASGEFFKQRSINTLSKGVLTQIEALFRLQNSLHISSTGFAAALDCCKEKYGWEFIAATGRFAACYRDSACTCLNEEVIKRVQKVADSGKSMFFGNDFVGYFPTQKDRRHVLFLEDCAKEGREELQYLLQVFANNVGIALDNLYLNQEIIDTQTEIVQRLGEVVESRSKETAYHVVRVAEYSYLLARACGLDEHESMIIKLASPMHDVGKIAIPDSILLKPGRLTKEEFAVIKTHTDIGYKILGGSKRLLLKEAAIISYTHHECWNGTGYPRGLAGEDIPLSGRITTLADIFDALCSERVYKKAWPVEEVFSHMIKESGKLFDPYLVKVFLENKEEVLRIRERYRDVIQEES